MSFFTSLGAFIGDVLVYPFDTLATRQKACQSTQSMNLIQLLQHIRTNENMTSLYRGINTSFMSIFVPTFVYFGIYEYLNIISHKAIDNHNPTTTTTSTTTTS